MAMRSRQPGHRDMQRSQHGTARLGPTCAPPRGGPGPLGLRRRRSRGPSTAPWPPHRRRPRRRLRGRRRGETMDLGSESRRGARGRRRGRLRRTRGTRPPPCCCCCAAEAGGFADRGWTKAGGIQPAFSVCLVVVFGSCGGAEAHICEHDLPVRTPPPSSPPLSEWDTYDVSLFGMSVAEERTQEGLAPPRAPPDSQHVAVCVEHSQGYYASSALPPPCHPLERRCSNPRRLHTYMPHHQHQ